MPDYCAVPLCKGFGGFHFPKDPILCKKWQIAIRRQTSDKKLWEPTKHSVVCAEHFQPSDFYQPKFLYGEKRRKLLKKDVVPSIFPFDKPNKPKHHEQQKGPEQTTDDSTGARKRERPKKLQDFDLGLPKRAKVDEESSMSTSSSRDVGYHRSDQRIRGLLRQLWQDEDSKDLKIVCRSRKIVKCHRAIFRIISPFLRQVLNEEDINSMDDQLVLCLPDFSCDVVRFLLKQAYATSTPDHPNNITFMCELKVLLNLLKVEFFVADNYEDYDDDIPNEDMFENERSLDNHDVVKSFSKFDVTEIKIEPDIYEEERDDAIENFTEERVDFQSQGITVKIPISEVDKISNDKKSNDGTAPRDPRKLTVNCIDCKTEILTTMEAYKAVVAKFKLPDAQFRYRCINCQKESGDREEISKTTETQDTNKPRVSIININQADSSSNYQVVGHALSVGRSLSETSVTKTNDEKLVVNCADCQTGIVTTIAKHEALLNRINEKKPAGSKRQTTIAYRCMKCHSKKSGLGNILVAKSSDPLTKPLKKSRRSKLKKKLSALKAKKVRSETLSTQKANLCPVCGVNIVSPTSLEFEYHMNEHEGKRPFKCTFCDFMGFSPKDVRKHERKEHNHPPTIKQSMQQCEKCPTKVAGGHASMVKHHAQRHDPSLPFGCDICFYRCKLEAGVKHHKSQMHVRPEEQSFSCKKCNKRFRCKKNMRSHIRKVCGFNITQLRAGRKPNLVKPDTSTDNNVSADVMFNAPGEEVPVGASAPEMSEESSMKFCGSCFHFLQASATVCPNCNERFVEKELQKRKTKP